MASGSPIPKLQLPTTTTSLSSPLAVQTQPATAPVTMTPAELEAAIAALSAKKQRLREAYDRLVSCSPVPVLFRWEDLDAHLSSLQSSIAVRFRHFQCHQAAAADDQEGDEDMEDTEASNARPDQEGDSAGNERVDAAIEAPPLEQEDANEENEGADEAFEASPRHGEGVTKMVEAAAAVNASTADQDNGEDDAEEAKWPRPGTTAGGGGETALNRAIVAACAGMDALTLVDVLSLSSRSSLRARRAFLPALRGAVDPHALVLRAVGGFLAGSGRKRNRGWGHCVALLECVPRLAAAPSPDALEQAGRLAADWKEMVLGEPGGSCSRDMGRLAGWGLFTFLASYNIVLEFDADEIIRLLDNLPPHLKENCIELCKHLGLIDRMTDSIDYLIENGQLVDAIRLAHALNLTYKYPPVSIMYDYVEKAKKTAEEILSKDSDSMESLLFNSVMLSLGQKQAMAKVINSLISSWTAVDECNIDSARRNSIKAEITQLLHKYANEQQRLADVPSSISSSHQQHNFEGQNQEQLQMPQEKQQQQKPEEGRQHQKQKAQEMQKQEQRWVGQKLKGRRKNKNCKRKQRRQKQKQIYKRPRLSPYVGTGIQNRHGFSGIRRAPFAAHTRPPGYFVPAI